MTARTVLILINSVINSVVVILGLIFTLYRDKVSQWIIKGAAQSPIDTSRYSPRSRKIQRTATALWGGALIASGLSGMNQAIGKILFGAGQKIVFIALVSAILACFVACSVVVWMGVSEQHQDSR